QQQQIQLQIEQQQQQQFSIQQQQQQQQQVFQPRPSQRFYLVSQWLNGGGDDAKYFPVYAPLKHAVIRSIASLLASGGWRGVEPPSPQIKEMLAHRASQLKSPSTAFSPTVST